MKNSIKLSDFSFKLVGYGHYKVTYTSPTTGKNWTATTNNMPLIDATKNSDNPKKSDLQKLQRLCKNTMSSLKGTIAIRKINKLADKIQADGGVKIVKIPAQTKKVYKVKRTDAVARAARMYRKSSGTNKNVSQFVDGPAKSKKSSAKKPTAKQLAARKKFAQMAKSGAFRKSGKKGVGSLPRKVVRRPELDKSSPL